MAAHNVTSRNLRQNPKNYDYEYEEKMNKRVSKLLNLSIFGEEPAEMRGPPEY